MLSSKGKAMDFSIPPYLRTFSVCLLFTIIVLSEAATSQSRSSHRATRADNLLTQDASLSLFHQGEGALLWDSDVLVNLRALHLRDIGSKEGLRTANNLAQHLNLSAIQSLHMPVPLYIVFVGFRGDGNARLNVSEEELSSWFSELDHVLPHTRVDLGEITCHHDGHCLAHASGILHGPRVPPLPSYVHLNFSCQVVVIRGKGVMAAFERAIAAFSRPVDPDMELGSQQVDARRMSSFVDHFVISLGLEVGYTLVVMNPTWSATEPRYGYRVGMSTEEIDYVLPRKERLALLKNVKEVELPDAGHWGIPWRSGPAGIKFGLHDVTWNSDRWLESSADYLSRVEDSRRHQLELVGGSRGSAAFVHAALTLARGGQPAELLRLEMEEGSELRAARTRFHTAHPLEDCMVGHWIGPKRWVMLDLTAGGWDWGPVAGGQGSVCKHSIPIVTEHFGEALRMRTAFLASNDAEGLTGELTVARNNRLATVANRLAHAHQMAIDAALMHANAPGADGTAPELDHRKIGLERNEMLLRAELDLYEEFAKKHCHEKPNPPTACAHISDLVGGVLRTLRRISSSFSSDAADPRSHAWDLFGSSDPLHSHPELATEAQRSADLFMAELSAVLSRAIRHVIAPPSAVWRVDASGREIAPPLAKEVHFSIYVIADGHGSLFRSRSTTAPQFDVDAFSKEIRGLALSNQYFKFTTHRLSLADDPLLATAFAASTRSGLGEMPAGKEFVDEFEYLYVDTAELGYFLRHKFSLTPKKSARPQSTRARIAPMSQPHEVPIFIFELDRDVAILLDQHYHARALEDMVVVIANAPHLDQPPTGLVCNSLLIPRHRNPMTSALKAVLMHLGGGLPPHMGYDPARGTMITDWLWSVGEHVQSFTHGGPMFTSLQRDALSRGALLQALDESVDALNAGVQTLQKIPAGWGAAQAAHTLRPMLRTAVEKYIGVVDSWRMIMTLTAVLDWASAVDYLPYVQRDVDAFQDAVAAVEHAVSPHTCGHTNAVFNMLAYISGALALGAVLFVFMPSSEDLLPPGMSRPHVN